MANLPLKGLKVIELSTYVAIPSCGRMMADMGAEVIKVESPAGDTWRIHGANNGIAADEIENPVFDVYNSGKRCIVLDLKKDSGKEIMHKLLADADIFITNTREKPLKKLGFDWDTVHTKYPKIIMGTLSGFGDKGPEKDMPGFDSVAFWAKTGFLADMTAKMEGGFPVQHPTSVGDTASASIIFGGIMAALYQREKSGVGELVSTSLYSAGIWYMSSMVIMAQDKYGLKFPKTIEERGAFRAQFACGDGEYVMVMILDEAKYADTYFDMLNLNSLKEDERFNTIQARRKHKEELYAIISPIFKTKTCAEWLDELHKRDIPCTKVNHFNDVEHSEQAWANEYIEEVHYANGTKGIMPCPPIRFNGEGYHTVKAELKGQSTNDVIKSLGYSEQEIAKFNEECSAIQKQ